MTNEVRHPVLYFRRCGWCGAYEGTVDEACLREGDENAFVGHEFDVYERLAAPDEDVPRPVDDRALPF